MKNFLRLGQDQQTPFKRKVERVRMCEALPDFQTFRRPCSHEKLPLLSVTFNFEPAKPKLITLYVYKFDRDLRG